MDATTGRFRRRASISASLIRSDAMTDPPGESTRTTSAFTFLSARASSTSPAMVSPPAVPGPASPSTLSPDTAPAPTTGPDVTATGRATHAYAATDNMHD